jgi:hypothetical protein
MAPAASLSAEKNSVVIKDISYRGATTADRRTSLDLYLPPPSTVKPPLFIFVHGGFWLLSDDEYQIGPSIAANLSRDGVAVALVRYRLAPAYRHPAQVEDVAAAVGYLIKYASQYGFDPKRFIWPVTPLVAIGVVGAGSSYLNRRAVAALADFDQWPLRARALVERVGQPKAGDGKNFRYGCGGSKTGVADASGPS